MSLIHVHPFLFATVLFRVLRLFSHGVLFFGSHILQISQLWKCHFVQCAYHLADVQRCCLRRYIHRHVGSSNFSSVRNTSARGSTGKTCALTGGCTKFNLHEKVSTSTKKSATIVFELQKHTRPNFHRSLCRKVTLELWRRLWPGSSLSSPDTHTVSASRSFADTVNQHPSSFRVRLLIARAPPFWKQHTSRRACERHPVCLVLCDHHEHDQILCFLLAKTSWHSSSMMVLEVLWPY